MEASTAAPSDCGEKAEKTNAPPFQKVLDWATSCDASLHPVEAIESYRVLLDRSRDLGVPVAWLTRVQERITFNEALLIGEQRRRITQRTLVMRARGATEEEIRRAADALHSEIDQETQSQIDANRTILNRISICWVHSNPCGRHRPRMKQQAALATTLEDAPTWCHIVITAVVKERRRRILLELPSCSSGLFVEAHANCSENCVNGTQVFFCQVADGVPCTGSRSFVVNGTGLCRPVGRTYYSTALLASIFGGLLGLDRFYLGYTSLGILKLVTGGFFGVGALVDLLLVLLQALGPADGTAYALLPGAPRLRALHRPTLPSLWLAETA
ncbi:hypothetical protein PAPYR_9464 [Paratrimastix pyriformis]|uniref:TM2 domain-containing protein n=1 Tax=Paratrimastix pyriformis TaxID=342808 RepID=A0ABQ8UE00_9EUKA|nr:hypothetical protein PAPYR_9464 [Paratrimastix pyriformis]